MAATTSTMLELGTPAPEFNLHAPMQDRNFSLDDFRGDPLLVIFMCNHCPYVQHILKGLAAFEQDFVPRGLQIVAINSNDIEAYPSDGPKNMIELAKYYQLEFPYLLDETQQVARDYKAACTPDFFLFNQEAILDYRGEFDGSRPRNDVPVSGDSLRRATEAVLAGVEPDRDQTPSLGCSIKWRVGEEPDYLR